MDISKKDREIIKNKFGGKCAYSGNFENVRQQYTIYGVMPRFCFICGTKLMQVGLGWLQCKSEQCGEVYLPFIDENNNQCLMHQRTPFSPK